MKGVFARSPFQFQIRDMDMRKPKAGEALIKVTACGVCGTDLHFAADWTADWMPLGHEISAEVVEVGEGVTHVKVGDKVVPEDVAPRSFTGNHVSDRTPFNSPIYFCNPSS